jgi:UPF0755 protein
VWKKVSWVVGGFVGTILLFIAATAAHFHHWSTTPATESDRVVTVARGTGFDAVMDELGEQDLLGNRWYFLAMARVKRADRKVRAGQYVVPGGTTPMGVLDILTSRGRDGRLVLTVPEGFTIYHVADRVHRLGLAEREDFLTYVTSPRALAKHNVRGDSLEGYLFPDTYFFAPGVKLEEIVARMVRRHDVVWKQAVAEAGEDEVAALMKTHDLSRRELIIMASVVEREAVVDEERPVIARVLLNRLEKGMRLQVDPTCTYGPAIYKKKASPKLCRDKKSRYSTYVIEGLPPGPIANPGRASLEAVVIPTTEPEKLEYLYFVAKRGGRTHTFSNTYEEHVKAIPR